MKLQITELLAALEAARKNETALKMFVGLDGFVDEILHVVDQRKDADNYTRINTLADFGMRIAKAAGLSTNIEFVPVVTKLGGNGPIYVNALMEYGADVTYVGAIGDGEVHPVFADMAKRGTVYPICEPAHSDACEFDDGKLIMGKTTSLGSLTWELMKERMGGVQAIADIIKASHLFGMENWTMVPRMSQIWEGIIAEVFPLLPDAEVKPLAFFDLADPEKRTSEDIIRAMELIGRFEPKFRVILGLNKKEAFEIASVLGVHIEDSLSEARQLEAVTCGIYKKLGIYCLVVHPTKEAAACVNGEYFHTDGPYTPKPVLTTGAGDNFNAGFCLGQALGLNVQNSLLLAVASSGFYVRNAKSASLDGVVGFLKDWEAEL